MILVLDIGPEGVQTVGIARQRSGNCRPAFIAGLRHFASRTRSVGGDDGSQVQFLDDLAALPERVNVAVHRPEGVQTRARQGQELMVHTQEMLADDVEIGVRHQMMNVRDAAGHRVFDRDHRQMRGAGGHHGEGIFKYPAGHGLMVGESFAAGDVGIGAGLTLIGNPFR